MHYRYGTNDQFERTKAVLNKRTVGASSTPRPLLDILNYAIHFPGFNTKVRFCAKGGAYLRTGTAPLYSRRPESSSRHKDTGQFPTNHAPPGPAAHADVRQSAAANVPPPGPSGPAGFPCLDDETVLAQGDPRISTPTLSNMLGIIVAVTLGLAIAGSNSFKIKIPVFNTSPAVDPASSRAIIAEPPLPALAMATPPTQPAAQADAAIRHLRPAGAQIAKKRLKKNTPAQAGKGAQIAKKRLKKNMSAQAGKAALQAKVQGAGKKKIRRDTPSEVPQQSAAAAVPPPEREPAYAANAAPVARSRYARCAQVSGLFRRERCKWQACDGKWGQDGCPAYQNKAPPFIGAMAAGGGMAQGNIQSTYPTSIDRRSRLPVAMLIRQRY